MTHLQVFEKNTMQQTASEKANQGMDLMSLAGWLFLIAR